MIRSLAVWMTSDVGRLLADDAGDQAAVGGRHVGQRVVLADGRAGVENVFEDVVGIGPVRAGELGTDVAASVKEPVARQAGTVEDGPPARQRPRADPGSEASTDLYLLTRSVLVFDVGCTLPQTASSRGRIRGSAKASNWRATVTLISPRGTRPRSTASRAPAPRPGARTAW